jgi:hypothetical protein
MKEVIDNFQAFLGKIKDSRSRSKDTTAFSNSLIEPLHL